MLPHAPQLLGSDEKDDEETHWPPQRLYPLLHASAHWPPLHIAYPLAAPAHSFPHVPQFLLSDTSDTHAPLHAEYPDTQENVHWPPRQTGTPFAGEAHSVPQLPQLLADVAKETHDPAQFVSPALVQMKPHAPSMHVAEPFVIGGHTFPTAPQLLRSDVTSSTAVRFPTESYSYPVILPLPCATVATTRIAKTAARYLSACVRTDMIAPSGMGSFGSPYDLHTIRMTRRGLA